MATWKSFFLKPPIVGKARMYCSTSQSIPNATHTKISLDTVSFDPDSICDTTNNRITPKVDGYYLFTGQVALAGSPSQNINLFVSLYKNGVRVSRGTRFEMTGVSGIQYGYLTNVVTDVVYCNGTTDYVELYVYQSTGGSRTIESGSHNNYLSCTIVF